MIDIKKLYDRVQHLAAKDQAGYNTPEEFNSRLYSVQLDVMEDLRLYYEKNQKTVEFLEPFIKTSTDITTADDGILDKPADVQHILAIAYKDTTNPKKYWPTKQLGTGQIEDIDRIPFRRADKAKNRVHWAYMNEEIQLYPIDILTVKMYYLIPPPEAKIVFTLDTSNPDEDFLVFDATNSVDLVWPEIAFNIFVYKMLDQLGVEIREQLLNEYARFGIMQERTYKPEIQ